MKLRFDLIAIVLLMVVLWYSIYQAVTLPTVYESMKGQVCVEVDDVHNNYKYTCENLPPKYYHVWVE